MKHAVKRKTGSDSKIGLMKFESDPVFALCATKERG